MNSAVLLRPVVDADSDLLFGWINDHDLVVFNAPFLEVSRPEHDAWFSRIRSRKDVVFFMIEDTESGKAIGSCQLLNIHSVHRSAELQIRIGSTTSQNRESGSEAVRQLIAYGFSSLGLHRIALHVFATNQRAIRVYEKNGFVREGLLRQAACIDGHWLDVVCMARVRGLDD
ncbi:GNAT family N-acetyltransferase [Dechloromonas sp. XY25]|uniref:GNAT family N-acetyltransferase n=1 Tax=Dechloromonas hankyongensis TaxID=2908002 RepID=A0ABS9JZD1_9RHOO|nr:GNAT family protein [Dechloromonas hankyongensis]MCG2576266.1 GNAT family N-acetyltransferase [Dechloromonas hankyongensis]